jgi:hypothetical protein
VPHAKSVYGVWEDIFDCMLSSSSVTISSGATPPIAFRKVLNSHLYDSFFSFGKKAAPNVIHVMIDSSEWRKN